ncbi:NAD(P)H-hydrate epimerase [Gonapodya sp. JEL0774]|nr:NAD(P)H-hydrate epimerase [Gonapodya sp. JEL0774]
MRTGASKIILKCSVFTSSGNNGGDALVAARHLWHFGYKPVVYYPKPAKSALFTGLATQLVNLNLPFISTLEDFSGTLHHATDVVLDGIFGFSFKGADGVRSPWDDVIKLLNLAASSQGTPIVSIDIPSGWDVELGPTPSSLHISNPSVLISLTAPKLCAQHFKGSKHWLGGRFVPGAMAHRLELNLPEYPGTEQVVEVGNVVGGRTEVEDGAGKI